MNSAGSDAGASWYAPRTSVRSARAFPFLALAVALAACGATSALDPLELHAGASSSSSSGPSAGTGIGGAPGAGGGSLLAAAVTSSGTGLGGAGGSPGTAVALTVKNYLSWCVVSVNGMASSALPEQTVTVAADSTVDLSATALTGFQLGDWHHTDGDTGSGDPGTVSNGESSTTVTVGTGTACVWVCCPFTNGAGCPTTDQCP